MKKIQNLVFPSGIGYDKSKCRVRTERVNVIFSAIPLLSRSLAKTKSGEPVDFNQFSARVTLAGIEVFSIIRKNQIIDFKKSYFKTK
jgi:hypothetical protein